MSKEKVTIPAEEFPHCEEYMRSEATKLPEWWRVPGAVKEALAKKPPKAASKPPKKA